MNEKALHTLEYDKIIEKLVGYAVSPMAKERAAALRPSAAMSDIIIWREETTEATTVVLKGDTFLRRLSGNPSAAKAGLYGRDSFHRGADVGGGICVCLPQGEKLCQKRKQG